MTRWIRRVRERAGDAGGFSVVELTVAASLMLMVVGIAGTALTNDLMRVNEMDHESRNIDVLRDAMARIERDIRSADCIGSPDASSSSPASGLTLAMWTASGGTGRAVTWAIPGGGGDLTRTVVAGTPPTTTTGTVATTMDASSLFTHYAPNPLVADQPNRSRVEVSLVRLGEGGQKNDRTFRTTVTARNADAAVPAGACP